ncbi:hypothetical protein BGZ60DRAFT_522852 [Tricladium varicosporioides]|nr:hypothetical protein BGZ60DRAFT_522852 [Hymenoscyphus varicosporioides]
MKATSILLLAVSAFTAAQDLPAELPDCGKACANLYFTSNSTMFANCATKDVACICTNKTFIDLISCCIFSNCNAADQQTVVDFATNLCDQVVISGTPSLPTSASCPQQTEEPDPETTTSSMSTSTTITTPPATATPTPVVTPAPYSSSSTSSALAKPSACYKKRRHFSA